MFERRHALGAVALASILAAWAGSQAQSAAPTVIAVQLSNYSYSPAEIVLTHGQAYVLHLTTSGRHAHDLSAKAFFRTVSLTQGDAAKVRDGDVEVGEGQSIDVAFVAGAPGAYEMHCTHPLHSMFGMKGRIIVR